MRKLTIIKLGGSIITDKSKPLTARRNAIRRLGREIVSSEYKSRLIITHGSGSFGHSVAKTYKTAEGIINKRSIKGMVLTSDVALEINRIVMKELIRIGMSVKSFVPGSFLVAENKWLKRGFIEPIKQSLLRGITPVVFGDVVMDLERGFCIFSTEKVIEFLVVSLNKNYKLESIIYCTDTDGVYDERGKTIAKITPKNFKRVKKQIGESGSADVTGGMIHKVEESLKLAKKFGLNVRIINGNKKGNLKSVLGGRNTQQTVIVT